MTITDRGKPAYVLKSLPQPAKMKATPRDYYARLLKRQPKALSRKQTRQFWEEDRGKRLAETYVDTSRNVSGNPLTLA